jgi:hypothetical protein
VNLHLSLTQMLSLLMFAFATAAAQADTGRAAGNSTSRVWIEGESNVADWSCKAQRFDAKVDSGKVLVRLSVRDLKCGNRKMDHDLYQALKASDPNSPSAIVAVFEAVPEATAAETPGTLEVVGIERSVTAQIITERSADGAVTARGAVPLLMTDFGVKPPVGLFGLIRSKNKVVVRFELVIPPRS